MKFINISNHPIVTWDESQQRAAGLLDGGVEVVDITFPDVEPGANEIDLVSEAMTLATKVFRAGSRLETDVMVQGEMNLTFTLVNMLLDAGYQVYAATSRRVVEDRGDGTKVATFKFVQFRPYAVSYPRLTFNSPAQMVKEDDIRRDVNSAVSAWGGDKD